MEGEQNSTLNIIREAHIWNLIICYDLNFDLKLKLIQIDTRRVLGNPLDKCGRDICKDEKNVPQKVWRESKIQH